MMESSRGALILLLMCGSIVGETAADTRYYVKMRTNSSDPFRITGGLRALRQDDKEEMSGASVGRAATQVGKTRLNFRVDDETMIRESLKASEDRRNSFVESSTFDPDVLNKFLDEYANKLKSNGEKGDDNPFRFKKPQGFDDDSTTRGDVITSTENDREASNGTENSLNSTLESTAMTAQELNDTLKRNKYFGSSTNDERNGWVTLDAIPWSKSKISKWQASSSSQRPWPEMKIWNKPNGEKPWDPEYPSRPAYVNNEPWNKPDYQSNRPDYLSDRPSSRPSVSTRPSASTRPSYFADRFDNNPNQAEKWPPERPTSSWEKFPTSDSYRPNVDIITDDRPSNFPNTWNKYSQNSNTNNNNNNNNNNPKPTYSNYDNNRDRFTGNGNSHNNNYNVNKYNQHDEPQDWHDHKNNYPSKDKFPSYAIRPVSDDIGQEHTNRPSHHQPHYPYSLEHPQSHPSSGEGQWVLLSTNRGYSKSRQRSIKLDAVNGTTRIRAKIDMSRPKQGSTKDDDDGTVAVMTSKRQVRLTVLPSINGTNTTTSHGGLLEVERTFKTVEQSQQEYEANKVIAKPSTTLKRRPIRNTLAGRPSNSAVLAAVGAGMLPATMAMMIPMMLGRKRRSIDSDESRPTFGREYDEDSSNSHRRTERRRRTIAAEERR